MQQLQQNNHPKRLKLIGDRAFYKKVLLIAVPIMLQNGITNFVNMLDNIMVGQVGTEQMSGVSIANQLTLVFNMAVFGAVAGAGILGAQFFGSKNNDGLRHTMRFKILCGVILTLLAALILIPFGGTLIEAFLHQGESHGDLAATLTYGRNYLLIMLIGMLPSALSQVYSSTLRETGQTIVPMISGIVAVLVDLVFNYILIFGKFGAPALGVEGAAIATVLSRFVELAIIVVWTHQHTEQLPFIKDLYRSLHVPARLVKQLLRVATPLFFNELLWSLALAFLAQCYSMLGLDVIAAENIANTLSNVTNVVFASLGGSVGIIVGQLLGAGELEKAREEDNQLIVFSMFCSVITGILLILIAPLFPKLYNTAPEIQHIAMRFIQIQGLSAPLLGFINASYFTLRSGGKTIITFLFDSMFLWVCTIPAVTIMVRFTSLPVVLVFLIDHSLDLIKCAIGFVLVKKGVWLQNLTGEQGENQNESESCAD